MLKVEINGNWFCILHIHIQEGSLQFGVGFFVCLYFPPCPRCAVMMQREEFQCKLLLKSPIIFILYLFFTVRTWLPISFSTSDLLANASSKPV